MDDAVKVISKKFEVHDDVLNNISNDSEDISNWLTVLAAYILDNDKKQEEQKASELSLRRQRLNAEHQLSQLEKQLIVCNSKLTKYEKSLLDAKTRLSKSEDFALETEKKFEEVTEEKKKLFEENEILKKKYSLLNEEKVEFSDIVEAKNKEIDRLNEEWKTMSDKLAESNKARCEIQYNLDEIKNSDVRKEFKEKRLEQEKNMLMQQLEQVTADLRQKTERANDFQKDKTAKLLDLESKYEISEQENLQLKQNLDATKETCKEFEKKIDLLMVKMKRASEEHVEMENNMQQELTAQTKLVQLYKDDRDHAKSKLEEVTTGVSEMQELLKQINEEKSSIEAKLQAEEEMHSKVAIELKQKLQEQSQELENANDLLQLSKRRVSNVSPDDISILSPMAAATSKILKKGMTLTQIYSEYVKVSDELLAEKDENSRLKLYMEQILQEVEEKAPLLMQQKEDYEHAKQTIESMSAKLQENIKECHRLQTEHMELERKVSFHKREEKRLKALSVDLSQQVCVLLKEVEEARGGVVSSSDKLPEHASTDAMNLSSSGQVISEHLVTFKSIEELQSQNERLLLTVRELSEEQEKLEQEGGPEIIQELKKKIENANGDLDALKQNQKTQDDMMEKLCRQRDIYKALCQKGGVMVGDVSSTSQPSTASFLETETELTMAKAELDNSMSQHEKLKESAAEKEKVWNEKLTKQDEELSLLRMERGNLKNQLSFADEKYSILKTTSEGYKKESMALEGKCKSIMNALNKLRVEAEKYKQDYQEAKEKLVAAEVSVKSSETEKHLHKEAEKRLMQENQSLLDQQRSQNVLFTNLQSIQNNLERQEFETRKMFTKQVERLQREIRGIRRQNDNDLNMLKVTNNSLEQEMKELKIRLAVELETKKSSNVETQSSKLHIEQLEAKCKELDGLYQASEKRLNEILKSDATAKGQMDTEHEIERLKTKARELELLVSSTTTEKKAVEGQLETAKKHLEQYQEIANSNEQAIKVIDEKLETQTKECERKLNEANEMVNSVKSQIASVVAEKIQMKKSAEEADKQYQVLVSELRNQTAPLEKRLQEVTRALVNTKEQEAAAVKESKEQVQMAKEASEKYERELVLHAKDVEQLTLLKEELHKCKSKYGGVEEQLSEMKQTLQNNESLMGQMKEHHSRELRKGEATRKDLIDQNSILHSQVEKLATAAAAASAKSSSKLLDDTVVTTDKSLEEVYELLRFVRREKEIAETKSEASATESMRYRQRADHLQRDLDETKTALELELERTKGRMLTDHEHADMMGKLKKFKEYEELNKNLEKQKNENLLKLKLNQEKVKKLEADMKPLQEIKKSLENEKSIWLGEKTALKAEIERWAARTNQLMAQNVKADAEEVKRLLGLKTQNEKTISSLQDDVKRAKQQLELLRRESLKLKAEKTENQSKLQSLQNELTTVQGNVNKGDSEQIATLQNEQTQLKKDLETKTTEMKKEQKTIQQLKKLARKYKGQADKLQKRLSENNIEFSDILSAPVGSAETTEVVPTPQTAPTAAIDPEEKKKLEETISEFEKKIEELNNTVLQLQEKFDYEQKLKIEKEEKFQETQKHYAESERKLFAVSSEADQLKKGLKDEREKQERNRKLVKTAKDKITSLTKLKDTKTQEIETLTKQNEDLKNQIQQLTDSEHISGATQELRLRIASLEKQVEGLLKEKETLRLKYEEIQVQYEKLKENKRATEKFIKASQHKTRLQPTVSTVEVAAAVATTEISAPLTATVRPTATSAQSSKFHAQVTTTPTASIRPLAHAAPTAMISPTVPVSTTPTPIASVSALPISTNVQPQVAEVQGRPSTNRPFNERPGTSFKAPVAVVTVQTQDVSSEDGLNVPNIDDVQTSDMAEAGPSTISDAQPSSSGISTSTKRSHAQLEDGQETVEETDLFSQAVGDNEPGIKRQRVEMSQPVEEPSQSIESMDSQEVLEEDELLGEATEDGDDEVLETAPQTYPETQSAHVGVSREVRLQVERTLQPSPQELLRQRSIPRGRAQLPSFSLISGQGSSGFYEDTDDSTVPSTPTLFMPKRTDGFAEAVSSPLIRLPTFSFTNTDQSTGSSAPALEQTGLQLNETRVDLLGSEDQANVPQTPLSIVPSVSTNELANVQAVQQQSNNRAAGSEPARHDAFFSEDNGQEQNVPQQIDLTEDDDDDDVEEQEDEDGDFDEQAEYEEEEEEEEVDEDEDEEDEDEDDEDEGSNGPTDVAELVPAAEEADQVEQVTEIYVQDDERGSDFASEEVDQGAGDEADMQEQDVEGVTLDDGGLDEVVEINAEENIDIEFPDADDNKMEAEIDDAPVAGDEKARSDDGASTSVSQRELIPDESSSSTNRVKTEDKTKPVRLQRSRVVRARVRRIPEEQTKPTTGGDETKPN